MLMIVALHIAKSRIEYIGYSDCISWIARSFCICAVDVFVLISGYFGIRSKISRFVSIDFQTIFYSISTLLLLFILGYHDFKVSDFHAFIPVLTKRYWFVTCYLVLYIITPFLNFFFDNYNKKEIKLVLIVGFVLFYLWPTFNSLIFADQLVTDNGYGIINFVYLYLLGRFIGKYGLFKRASRWSFVLLYIVTCLFLAIIQPALSYVVGFEYHNLYSYNTFFVFVSALSLFLYFERLSFSSTIINRLAKNCLAVYLIHQGPQMWESISMVFGFGQLSSGYYILSLFIFPIVLYLVAVIIDSTRAILFKPLEEYVSNHLTVFLSQIKSFIT